MLCTSVWSEGEDLEPRHLLWFRPLSAALGRVQPLLEFDTGLLWFWILTNKCAIVKHTLPHELFSSVWLTTDCMHRYDSTPVLPRRDGLYHLGLCKYAVAKSPNDAFLQMYPRQPHARVHVWVCWVYVGRGSCFLSLIWRRQE